MNVVSVLQDCLLICFPFNLSSYLGMKSLPPSGLGKHSVNLSKSTFFFENHAKRRELGWSSAAWKKTVSSEGRFRT